MPRPKEFTVSLDRRGPGEVNAVFPQIGGRSGANQQHKSISGLDPVHARLP